jgi:hypothetical protein
LGSPVTAYVTLPHKQLPFSVDWVMNPSTVGDLELQDTAVPSIEDLNDAAFLFRR